MAAARPFAELPLIMAEVSRDVTRGVGRLARATVREIDRGVVLDTPVDTGEARSNFVGTVGTPFQGRIPPYAPGSKLGKGESANAAAAMAQVDSAVQRWRDTTVASGVPFYITNNAPHTELLELGTAVPGSKQTAPGWIYRAIVRAVNEVRIAAFGAGVLGR